MSKRFDAVDMKFEAQTLRFNRIDTMMDEMLKKQEISDDERIVMGHQLDRMNQWVQELADKIGYKLAA